MLHLAGLGLGLAIVNGICVLPRGAVARPIRELGHVTYRLLVRRGAVLPPPRPGSATGSSPSPPRREPAL